jgi:hypothetical protein
MKIIDKKENTTLFKNVDIGEVFKIDDDSSYTYMKIILINDEFNKEYNAVCLNDGDLLSFGDERKVFTYPYSELIIKR